MHILDGDHKAVIQKTKTNTGLLIVIVIKRHNIISKIASVTILGIRAALVTDVHQSTDAQKGNPPSRAHHQHHHLFSFLLEIIKQCGIPGAGSRGPAFARGASSRGWSSG